MPQQRTTKTWKATPDSGADYTVDPTLLHQLQQKHPKSTDRRLSPGKLQHMRLPQQPLHEALSNRLSMSLTDEPKAARQRLQEAFAQVVAERLEQPDLMIKIVPDLDSVLFDGTLTDHIMIAWADLSTSRSGVVEKPMCKIQVQLNKSLFAFGGKWEVLGALVYELLHAYFVVMGCAWDEGSDWFSGLAERVVARLGLDGFEAGYIVR